MNYIRQIQETLKDCIERGKVFIYESNSLKAVAFFNGLKRDDIKDIKKDIKNNGYDYNHHFECYILEDKSIECNLIKRKERDEFINKIISWKMNDVG
jgi:hypothetical protein